MPWVRNSWPRLIGSQPKATEIVSTEDSLSQRTWHNRQRSKNMSTATVTRSTRLIGDPEAIEATLRPSAGLEHQAIALETKHLSRSLVGRVLVNDVSVQVQPGEVLAVVGPSGGSNTSFLAVPERPRGPTTTPGLPHRPDFSVI